MSLLDATGRALTPLEMLAVQVRGMQPVVGGGARSLYPQAANIFAQGLTNSAPVVRNISNLGGFALNEGAPFNIARSFASPAAATGLAEVAGDVAAAGGGAGLLARLGAVPAGIGAAGLGTVATRAGLGGLAGSIGSGIIDKVTPGSNSLAEQTLQGGALGAGIGAAVGGIPTLGLGAVPGALIGGGIGAIGGALTSLFGKKPKAPESIDSIMARVIDAGAISPASASAIAQKYAGMVALDDSKKGKELARQAALQLLQAEVMNPSASPMAGATPQQWTPEQILATQVQAAKYLAPFAQQSVDNAARARDITKSLTQGLNPAAAKFLQIGAEQEYAASTKLANAYAAQALLSPQMAALQQQQQYQQQIASQLAQQSIAKMLSGGSTGGQDLGALLGQLGAGGQ